MARKAPSGPKHDRCIDHAEHPYPAKGMLCIGAVIGREGMIAFADELAGNAAQHRAAFLAETWPQPSAKARKPVRPLLPLASPLNDGMVEHRCPATAEHGNRIRASFLIPGSRGRYGVCVSCGWDAPERPFVDNARLIGPFVAEMESRPELPAGAFAPRSTADGVSLAELHARFMAMRGRPVEAPAPVLEPTFCAGSGRTFGVPFENGRLGGAERVGMERCPVCDRLVIATLTGRSREIAIARHLPAVAEPSPTAVIVDGTVVAMSRHIDISDTYAAAVELAETRPDPCEACQHSAHGATCLPCEDAAQVGVYAPCAAPKVEPAPVEPIAEPIAVLSAPAPAERPTCPRCGQSFRVKGTGRDWHVANRPDCARVAVAV